MELSVRDLTGIMRGTLILGDPKSIVSGASADSRLLPSNNMFFALKGERADGHDFAMSACKKGASVVVVSKMDWFRSDSSFKSAVIRVNDTAEALRLMGRHLRMKFKGTVVGITGSNGKTTTKQMTASVLNSMGEGLSTVGNYNSRIGLPIVLSKLDKDHKWMVLEMGASAPGDISSLAEVAMPNIGIITSIGPAHLATFGSLNRIAESKWELFDSLPSDGCAILPWGEASLEPFVRVFKKRIVFFGEDPSCPIRATSIEFSGTVKFMLHVGSKSTVARLPIPGRCNVGNALAAASVGWVLGRPLEEIVSGLETFDPPKMRMETLRHSSGAILINDAYNANPASMILAVRSLVESYPGQTHVLALGSMLELGEETEKYHFHLGTELAKFELSQVFLTGPETKMIAEGARSAGAPAGCYHWCESTEEMANQMQSLVREGTVFLFKGSRGVQMEKALEKLLHSGNSMEKVV